MNIPDTHYVRLVFRIDAYITKPYIDIWIALKKECEYNNANDEIVKEWLSMCKTEIVRNLPYLDCSEGGIGYNNMINKQIRFRPFYSDISGFRDNYIILDVQNGNEEKWTLDELDDLIYGFVKYSSEYVMKECIEGVIEFVNKNNFDDNYL
jgi:hypothetical protein